MSKFLTFIVSYGTYAAIAFNLFNQESPVVAYLENWYVLYNIFATVSLALAFFMMGVFALTGRSIKKDTLASDKDFKELRKALLTMERALNNTALHRYLTSAVALVCGVGAFVILSQFYMGFLLITGVFLSLTLSSQVEGLVEQIEEKNVKNA